GWGLDGHANTNEELVAAARAQIASLQAGRKAEADSTACPQSFTGGHGGHHTSLERVSYLHRFLPLVLSGP
ncbi:MAG TPA: hypothetical protein VF256_21995, partial [Streptosporangiaceae bacterium]